MKRITAIALCFLMLFLVGCDKKQATRTSKLGSFAEVEYTVQYKTFVNEAGSIEYPIVSAKNTDTTKLNEEIYQGAKAPLDKFNFKDGMSEYIGKCSFCSLKDGIVTVGYESTFKDNVQNTTQPVIYYDNYDVRTGAWQNPADLFNLEYVVEQLYSGQMVPLDSKIDAETAQNQIHQWLAIYGVDPVEQLSYEPVYNGERQPVFTSFAYSGYDDVVVCLEGDEQYGYYPRFKLDRENTVSKAAQYLKIDVDENKIFEGITILINAQRPVVEPDSTKLVKVADKKNKYYEAKDGVKVHKDMMSGLNALMLGYTTSTGKQNPTVVGGVDATDNIEHKSGYAVDVTVADGDYSWFEENASLYGFITDKQHMRFVGVPHAQLAQTYESYEQYCIDLEQTASFEKDIYTATIYQNSYEVFYMKGTEIYVPRDGNYTVTGNNLDGFYITRQVNKK